MDWQSGLSELSVISWVSAVQGCPLSGVPLYITRWLSLVVLTCAAHFQMAKKKQTFITLYCGDTYHHYSNRNGIKLSNFKSCFHSIRFSKLPGIQFISVDIYLHNGSTFPRKALATHRGLFAPGSVACSTKLYHRPSQKCIGFGTSII